MTCEPSTVVVDIITGDQDDKACRQRVKSLHHGIRSIDLPQADIDHFIETPALEAPVFRGQMGEFEKLVALWTEDTRKNRSCAWCAAAGAPEASGINSLKHARAHLEGRMPATSRDWSLKSAGNSGRVHDDK